MLTKIVRGRRPDIPLGAHAHLRQVAKDVSIILMFLPYSWRRNLSVRVLRTPRRLQTWVHNNNGLDGFYSRCNLHR